MIQDQLGKTALYELHKDRGAKFVEFAGYSMPLNYSNGSINEHLHTRSNASIFDVSHMGQIMLVGQEADAALECISPGEIQTLKTGQVRYTMFTNKNGGILDDLMVSRSDSCISLVVNASRKEADLILMRENVPENIVVESISDRSLLALQGPKAREVLSCYTTGIENLKFMTGITASLRGIETFITRCGYTGEDGFEISVHNDFAESLVLDLLSKSEIELAGLGARDSLRLESALCLYGQDLNPTITPIEADLAWTISKRRRTEGGFTGYEVIKKQLTEGVSNCRVGLVINGRVMARKGTEIFFEDGELIGNITSGGYAPSLDKPIAMGYVKSKIATTGQTIFLDIRKKRYGATLVQMPFVPHRYARLD